MVAYTTTPVDVEAGPEAKTVVLVEKKSPAEWIWKVCAVLVVVALCLAGVLLFAWYWNTRPERMVRSISSFRVWWKVFQNLCVCLYMYLRILFSSMQTQVGQPEALKAKNTGEKPGDYTHGCLWEVLRATFESLWIIWDKLTFFFLPSEPHSTIKWISSKAKAAIHLEGESPLTLIWSSANNRLIISAFKGAFLSFSSPSVVLVALFFLETKSTIRKSHKSFISFSQYFILLSK